MTTDWEALLLQMELEIIGDGCDDDVVRQLQSKGEGNGAVLEAASKSEAASGAAVAEI